MDILNRMVYTMGIKERCEQDALARDAYLRKVELGLKEIGFIPTASYGQYILGKPANGLGNRAIYQPAAS